MKVRLENLENLSTKVNVEGKRARIKNDIQRFKRPLNEDDTRGDILQIDRLKTHLLLELQACQASTLLTGPKSNKAYLV
jgi:hypothetical protein